MKTFFDYAFDRVTAVILLIVLTVLSVGSGLAINCLCDYNFYGDNGKTAWEYALQTRLQSDIADIEDYCYCYLQNSAGIDYPTSRLASYDEEYNELNTNVLFHAMDKNGKVFFGTYEPETDAYQYRYSKNFSLYLDNGETVEGTIECFVRDELTAKDGYLTTYKWIKLANTLRYAIFFVLALSGIALLATLTFLTCGAGHKDENGVLVPSFIDRLPLDLLTLIAIALEAVGLMCVGLTGLSEVGMVEWHVVIIIVSVALMTVLLAYSMSLSVRVKLGEPWKNTVIYRVYKSLCRGGSRSFRRSVSRLSYFKRLVIIISVVGSVGAAAMVWLAYRYFVAGDEVFEYYLIYWIISRLIVIPVSIMIILNLHYLQEYGKRLAAGDLSESSEPHFFMGSFRKHEESLERLRRDMSDAAEQEIRTEKLKNELLTNISHDIKTPLTSIINYVGLLKRGSATPEHAAEYVEVLARNSEKIKKLLDDLLESSQASSGELEVHLAPTDVGVLLEQSAGEYGDMFEGNNLELVLTKPDGEVKILADSNLLCRVFENLISNICKYALPSTRIFLTVEDGDGKTVVTFKNIAKSAITKNTDELFERFVRGDSSRHTDGNGLGLSIAKSLTELQQGSMELAVDGDLFKVILTFKKPSPRV